MKSYLIIGASGFIGSNIINCLSQKSRILIITTNKDKIQKIIKKKFINLRIENYNFLNKKNLKKIQSYKTIINCAGVYFKGNNLNSLIKVNYTIPKNLYNLCKSTDFVRFINFNTLLKNKLSPYVKYKHKLTSYFKKKNIKNIKVIDLHISHLYGDPRYENEFILKSLTKFLTNSNNLNFTNGLQKRDFLHIKDFKKIFKKILFYKSSKNYEKLNIGFYKSYKIRSVVVLIKKLTKSHKKINFGALKYKRGEEFNVKSHNNLKKRIIWKPKINLKKGILLLIQNLKKNEKKK